ncbi:MAG: hypothetical protein AB1758_38440, partial [Candidatus Eremiobacterota bacterium]
DLWGSLGFAITHGERSFDLRECLGDLLRDGKLSQKDREGKTLLENLDRLTLQNLGSQLEEQRWVLVGETLIHVARPEKMIFQGDRGTCAATTLQYLLARKNPAEYVRVVSGLASPAGQVRLQKEGLRLRTVPDSQEKDTSGRGPACKLVQAALMDLARFLDTGGHEGVYSNSRDKFQATEAGRHVDFGTGLSSQAAARLHEALLGDTLVDSSDYMPLLADRDGAADRVEVGSKAAWAYPERIVEFLEKKTADGHAFYTALKWPMSRQEMENPGGHAVAVVAVKDGRVHFRNPWGHEDNPTAFLYGVDHQRGSDGMESLPIQDFCKLLKHVAVPRSMLE